jgi:hypothetical protein
MSKTPEEMAEEYANSTDSCDVDQEYAFAYKGFLAGYKAGYESLHDQLQSLESQLRQANGMVMKLDAEHEQDT